MRSVLVTHPGLQHSHQLALALHERALLQSFWSVVPVAAPGESLPWWLPARFRNKVRRVAIPRPLRRHPLRFQLLAQVAHWIGPGPSSSDRAHRIFHRFDAWAARGVPRLGPKLVVAYENAAYHTFRAAREIGARCVLDAASLHHRASAEWLGAADTPYTAEINRRKDEEVRLADLILTCSPLAAESYAANGVPLAKLHALILGAEIPADLPIRRPSSGPPRFVFAGLLTRRKSIDIILAAFHRLHAEGSAYALEFVGGVADPELLPAVLATPHARHTPGVSQQELFSILAQADCLLLPSRFDSFGMVVAEAMACGTPAVVSTRTGAKAMIEAFPGSGWIVEPEVESLHALLARLIANPAQLQAARALALESGKAFSWTRYRSRAGQLLEDFLR